MINLFYNKNLSLFLLFLLPSINFLHYDNVSQISLNDILYFFLYQFFLLVFLFFISFFLSKIVFFKKIKIKDILFSIVLFHFFYFNIFFINDFLVEILKLKSKTLYISLFIILILFIIYNFISLFSYKFKTFFSVFIGVFCLISIASFIPYYYKLLIDFNSRTPSTLQLTNIINESQNFSNKKFENIYFIIMDEMISLENAIKLDITSKQNINDTIFKYVPNSYSSYDGTHKTLSSLFHLDYFKPAENSNLAAYYPANLSSNKSILPLSYLTKQLNTNIIFNGNNNIPCKYSEIQNIKCTHLPFMANIVSLKNILLQFYLFNEIPPLMSMVYKLETFQSDYNIFNNEGGQRNLNYFIKYINQNNNILKTKGNFYLIHQMSPHSPMTVNSKCEFVDYRIYSDDYYKESYEGYKNSYQCVLSEIYKFSNFIEKNDPDAIVVIMGDHGTYIESKAEIIKDKILFRANVFNAIKAPDNCFKEFGTPRTTVNSIRFVLNCAYGFNFEYKDIIHIKGSGKEEKVYYFD